MAASNGGSRKTASRLNIGDAIHDGWSAFCRAPWSFVLFAVLLTSLQLLLQPLQEGVLQAAKGETIGGADWLLALVGLGASLAVSCWGTVGMVDGAWRALAGERPTLGSLLRWDGPGFGRVLRSWTALGAILLLPLLALLALLAGALLLVWVLERSGLSITDRLLALPSLLFGLLTLFVLGLLLLALLYFGVNQQFLVQIALLEKQSGWASVQRGRALIDPQWPLLLLLGLIKALLLVLGLVSFGVGLLVVWPVASVITTAAYRQLVRANPQLTAPLSSPTAY